MAPYSLPIGTEAQRRTERLWLEARAGSGVPDGVREVVRDSWARSLRARISPAMAHAPTVWDEDALAAARERTDWLPLARRAMAAHGGAYAEGGHILALFDGAGRMLAAEGDPGALDGLQGINFRPGSLWAEHAVGTNGPGTALALGRGVHVVGAEHFCEGWHPWHCAAVPVRDQLTGDIRGVVDLSGFRDAAHPHTLTLAVAIAVAIEQMLAARDAERRVGVLRRFADAACRWPGDALVAVDRSGAILAATHGVPASLHPLAPVSGRRQVALAEVVNASTSDAPREVWVQGGDAFAATAHPVFDGEACVGACLVLRAPSPTRHVASAGTTLHDGAGRLRRGGGAGETRYSLYDVVGETPALAEAQRIAVAAASNALPVLILGESGTGKELFAQGIHAASARAGRPFVAVNCAALPRDLVESELFGYVGGAFTGARREGGAGKFEAADGGTIFLDEVSELPPAAQATLLRVLQEGEVTRVGATQPRRVDVRVIAATNCDLAEHLASGALRRDLYYRLGVLAIELPPLRERAADVPRLARRFLAAAEEELGRPGHTFAPGVLETLAAYDWPGNVREMKNLVRRLVALVPADEITVADLPHAVRQAAGLGGSAGRGGVVGQGMDAGVSSGAATSDADPRAAAARERITRAVRATRTMGEAAALLGVTRSTLYRQMARYGLHPERVVRADA